MGSSTPRESYTLPHLGHCGDCGEDLDRPNAMGAHIPGCSRSSEGLARTAARIAARQSSRR